MEYGDITARKHGGNELSIEANAKVDKSWQHRQILTTLLFHGPKTGKEIARILDIEYHRISGRFKALRTSELITLTGNKRENSNEYELAVER